MTDEYTLGAYRLIAELGHGGMADVFLAAIEGPAGSGFSKLAVVKKLRSHLAEDPEFVAMLMDEARLTARLTHPNVIQLFELGHVDGQYFLAMEYLDGQPFHRVAQRVNRLAPDVARDIFYSVVSDTLAGLHHAHELKDYDGTPLHVVHRDVTPHNVFVTYDGAVKVVDFGIAKAVGRATETQVGVVKGKVRYMSPEQAAGNDADRRTDIFAAGVMLWNAATQGKLWGGLDNVAIARSLYDGTYPVSPREECPDVPEAIDAICRRALAFRREDRYETADDMRADIERFLGGRSAEVRKTRAATMKNLFEKDRAKVRAVLEASVLNTASRVGGLVQKIPTGPQFPVPGATTPSVAPFALPASDRTQVMAGGPQRVSKSTRPKVAKPKPKSAAGAFALAASVAAAGVILGAVALLGARASSPVSGAEARAVTPDFTTYSLENRNKAERPATTADDDEDSSKSSSRTRRSASQRATPREAAHGAPARNEARAAGVSAGPSATVARTGKLLDGADPWSADHKK